MRAVIFGGSGFLGSYVIDELMSRGWEVICADKQIPRFTPKVKFIPVDITQLEQVKSVIPQDSDVVYNFAGLADINLAKEQPLNIIELNILGNANILEACRGLSNLKRFVFASSAYAFSEKGSFYGISKLSAEKIIEEYGVQYGLPYTILRYGSLYGERADVHNGIFRLLYQALKDRKIIYRGSGEEVREYIHCRDAAKLSVDILSTEFLNQHVVLTGLEKHKYKDLLTMLQEIFNHEIEIEYKHEPYSGHYTVTPYSFRPIIGTKLINNPYIDLGQGLLECITCLHQQLQEEAEV